MTQLQIADAHLTYVASNPMSNLSLITTASYDVYGPSPGPQLGDVYRTIGGTWVARQFGDDPHTAAARTRWEAATTLWPT